MVADDPHRLLDPGEIAHRGAKLRVLEADSHMSAARHRLADQRPDIDRQPRDHPGRGARSLLEEREMGGERVGLGGKPKARVSENMKR